MILHGTSQAAGQIVAAEAASQCQTLLHGGENTGLLPFFDVPLDRRADTLASDARLVYASSYQGPMPWSGLTARNQSAQALTRCAFFGARVLWRVRGGSSERRPSERSCQPCCTRHPSRLTATVAILHPQR